MVCSVLLVIICVNRSFTSAINETNIAGVNDQLVLKNHKDRKWTLCVIQCEAHFTTRLA
jgi:hypothetical protein